MERPRACGRVQCNPVSGKEKFEGFAVLRDKDGEHRARRGAVSDDKRSDQRWMALGLGLLVVVVGLMGLRTCGEEETPASQREQEAVTKVETGADVASPSRVEPAGDEGTSLTPTLSVMSDPESFAMVGRVTNARGGAVEGATVSIVDGEGVVTEVKTELDGSFRTGALGLGLFDVRASKEGMGEAVLREAVPGGPALALVLSGGASLVGRVVTSSGTGVESVVHVGGAGLFPMRVVKTDASGQFSVDGLPSGRFQIMALAGPLGSRMEQVVEVGPEGGEVTLVVQRGERLDVEVREAVEGEGEGREVEGAVVTVSKEPLYVFALHQVTDLFGMASMEGMATGRYVVSVRAEGYLPHAPVVVEVPQVEPLAIALDPGAKVSGRIARADDTGVALASVVAHVATSDGARWELHRESLWGLNRLARPDGAQIPLLGKSYVSGSDGSFEVVGLPSGRVLLEPRKKGWVPVSLVEVDLRQLDVLEGVVLRMERGVSVEFRIEGAGGIAVEGARVRWRLAGERLTTWRGEGRSDAGGMVRLEGVGSQIALEVEVSGYERYAEVLEVPREQRSGDAVVVGLVPLEGLTVGRVLGRTGGALGGVSVRLERGRGVERCAGESDGRGMVVLEGCGDAPVVVRLTGPSVAPAWARVVPGEPFEVQMSEGAMVVGTVVDDLGEAVEGARVELEGKVAVEGERVTWKGRHPFYGGRVEMGYVPPGTYRLEVRAPGYASWSSKREVRLGERWELGRVVMERLVSVEGVVVDERGGPAEGAQVWLEGGEEEPVITDGSGIFVIEGVGRGDVEVRARHWAVGEGRVSLRVGEGEVNGVEVRLEEPLGGALDMSAALGGEGLVVEREGSAWLVVDVVRDSKWWDAGVRRGDFVEGVEQGAGGVEAIWVVREGERRRHAVVGASPR